MKKLLLMFFTIFLTSGIWSFAQDTSPLPNINIKKLIAPNNPTFYYNPVDSALWMFKGETGWIRIATNQQLQKYYTPYNGAIKNLNLGIYSILAEGQQLPLSNGGCQISSLTDNGNGTVTLGSGDYHLSANVSGKGSHNYTLVGGTWTLTDQSQNYIVADYNSGSPYIHVITDVTLINETTIVPIYSIYRNGNVLHTQNWDALGLALSNKIHQSIVKTQRYRRESGLALSEYGTHNLNLSVGRIWTGAVPITLDAIATATDNLVFYKHSGGVWTSTVQTTYNFTQYDNGTNLVDLTANRYAVNWVFRGVENQKHLYIVAGIGDYTEAQATAATLPAIPVAISSHAVLVAKLIVRNNSATALSIQSAFDVQFGLSAIQSHGDLTGRDVVDSHPAGAITNTPYSTISAISVQGAINELADEKENISNKENTTVDNSTTKYPTVNLLKTYADTKDPSITNEIQAPTRVGDAIGLTQTSTTISIADKEPAFSKNTAFNKNFGTTAGTVLEGRTFGTAANNNTGDFAPASGSGNYIQNGTSQQATSNYNISGYGVHGDYIQATTAKLTNLTDGYIPYHISDASGLGNSPIEVVNTIGLTDYGSISVNKFIKSGADGSGSSGFILNSYSSDSNSRQWGFRNDIAEYGDFAILKSIDNTSFPTVRMLMLNKYGNVGIGYYTGTEITNNKLAVNGSIYGNTTLTLNGLASTSPRLLSSSSTGQLTAISNAAGYLFNDGSGNFSNSYPEGINLRSTGSSLNQVLAADGTNGARYISLNTINGNSLFGVGNITAGNVNKVGTPVDNQIGVWTGDGTIEGISNLTYGASQQGLSIGVANSEGLSRITMVDPTGGSYANMAITHFGPYINFNGGVSGLSIYNNGIVKMPNLGTGTTTSMLYIDTDGTITKGVVPGGGSGMTNPMTTTGDIIYSSSGTTPARRAIGSTGQILTVSGGVPIWANAPSGTSQWTTDTNGITYQSGNVGVGIASSSNIGLYVSKSTSNGGYISYMNNTNASAGGLGVQTAANSSSYPILTLLGNTSTTRFNFLSDGTMYASSAIGNTATPYNLYFDPANGKITYGSTGSGGSGVTSVSINSPIITGNGGTFAIAAITNPTTTPNISISLQSQTEKKVLISPVGGGVPSYDQLNYNYISQIYAVQSLSGTTPSWNVLSGMNATLTLSGNTTITLSNLVAGMTGNIRVTNAATAYTLTFAGATIEISPSIWSSGDTVFTSGASKTDCFSWYYDGAKILINGTLGYN